jgi:hypothetical protein
MATSWSPGQEGRHCLMIRLELVLGFGIGLSLGQFGGGGVA